MVPPPSYCCMRNVFDSGDHVQAVVSEAGIAGAVDQGEAAERVVAHHGPWRGDRPQPVRRIVSEVLGPELRDIAARVMAERFRADLGQLVEPVGGAGDVGVEMAGPGIAVVGAGAGDDLGGTALERARQSAKRASWLAEGQLVYLVNCHRRAVMLYAVVRVPNNPDRKLS